MDRRKITVDGIEWSFVDQGSGPTILLVHGFPLDHTMWRFQWPEWSTRFRVIAPDLPGFGCSNFVDWPIETSMVEMADQLAEFLNSLGVDQIAFCGLSMGGYIGWPFWERHADRLTHLIACNTRSIADTPEVARGRRIVARGVLENGADRVAEAMIPKLFSRYTRVRQPELIAQLASVISSSCPEIIALGHRAMADRPDMSERIRTLPTVPTLLVGGQLDEISTPEEMKAIADSVDGAQWVCLSEAGHLPPLESPNEFNRVVGQFLASSASCT